MIMKKTTTLLLAASTATLLSLPVFASGGDADTHELQQLVEKLQARVTALEAARTFTSFMPDFAERFHVLHRAGEAGDWAVASHELSEMKRMVDLSPTIDAKNGELMKAMLAPSLDAIDAAVDDADGKKFEQALEQTVNTCNACHAAAGSPFIDVTLNANEALSMRHPHRFLMRKAMGGHQHGMSEGMGGAMHSDEGEADGHGHEGEADAHGHTAEEPAHTD